MTGRLGVTLRDHEEQYAVVRAAPLAFAPRFAWGLAWTLTPFFFLFPLLRLDLLGIVFIALLAVSGVLYLLNLRAGWYGSGLVVTNQRCIDVTRKGIGPPLVTDASWRDIERISVVPGPVWHRLLGLGGVRVELRGPSPFAFLLSGVRNPDLVAAMLSEVQSKGTKKRV
ncbi:hypothetical protein HYS28_02260 [Candidatus Uhrbacteria bacterium]|nr:hypothetical protein [Candidatus Uhrbacteria bacterium]